MTGIYIITNKVNNRFYIGSCKNFNKRVIAHRSTLNCNKHHCKKLQRDWNKYKEESFKFEFIEEWDNETKMEREDYWLKLLTPYYNTSLQANVGRPGIRTQEWKESRYNNNLSKKVYQFTLRGEFIKEWASISEAGRHLELSGNAHISSCCLGKRNSAHGYLWSYTSDLKDKKQTRSFTILQYDLEGNFIKEWKSIKQIAKELEVSYYVTLRKIMQQTTKITKKNNILNNWIWKKI